MGSTYYIDYGAANDSANGLSTGTPWKRCPGMVGFAGSYSHAVGDVFVFKGGVTWAAACFPLTIGYSGSAGNVDTYTVDESWYTGGSWTQPIFDENHGGGVLITASTKHHFRIDDLNLINVGTTLVNNSYHTITFTDCYEWTISNNTFKAYTWFDIFAIFSTAGSYSNFYVYGNDFSSTTSALWFAHNGATATDMHNLIYRDNTFHDFADMLGGGSHGDGALHYFSSNPTTASQYLDGFEFYNNVFYGDFTRGMGSSSSDMTSFIYIETALSGNIYNNVFTFYPYENPDAPADIFYGVIAMVRTNGRTTNLNIVNNTFYADPDASSGGYLFVINQGYPNVTIKNNVCVYQRGGACDATPVGLSNDYNEWWVPGGFSNFGTYGAHNIPAGSPYTSDPLFVDENDDLRLTASSPGKDAGADLTSLGISGLAVDKDGKTRPIGAAWDMGAYEYGGAVASTEIKFARIG